MTDQQTEPGNALVRADHAPMLAVSSFTEAGKVAATLCNTSMVPKGMRGDKAAVFACIVWASEAGLGIMQALNGVHVIEGHTAPKPELMRALVRRAGHTLKIMEYTDERCTIYGRRADDPDDDLTVTFTLEDARRAGLLAPSKSGAPTAWQKYPRAMLLARASGEIGRAMFSDVIAGLGYSADEVAFDILARQDLGPEATADAARTEAEHPAGTDPDADTPDDPDAPIEATVIDMDAPMDEVTNRRLFAMLSKAAITDADRHAYATQHLEREVTTFKDLTNGDAHVLIAACQADIDADATEPVDPDGMVNEGLFANSTVVDNDGSTDEYRRQLTEAVKSPAHKAAFLAWCKGAKATNKIDTLTPEQVREAVLHVLGGA